MRSHGLSRESSPYLEWDCEGTSSKLQRVPRALRFGLQLVVDQMLQTLKSCSVCRAPKAEDTPATKYQQAVWLYWEAADCPGQHHTGLFIHRAQLLRRLSHRGYSCLLPAHTWPTSLSPAGADCPGHHHPGLFIQRAQLLRRLSHRGYSCLLPSKLVSSWSSSR